MFFRDVEDLLPRDRTASGGIGREAAIGTQKLGGTLYAVPFVNELRLPQL